MSQFVLDIPDDRRSFFQELLRNLPWVEVKQVEPSSASDESPLNATVGAWGRGAWKGKVWMADDFDAPLESFNEYLP